MDGTGVRMPRPCVTKEGMIRLDGASVVSRTNRRSAAERRKRRGRLRTERFLSVMFGNRHGPAERQRKRDRLQKPGGQGTNVINPPLIGDVSENVEKPHR